VFQRQYNPARLRPMVEIIAKDAVAAMMRRIGGAFNVQRVILAGAARPRAVVAPGERA